MDNDIKLVTLVKQYECIYTRFTNDNKNKELLENVWQTIADQMNTSITDCKRRWCVLRNRYAKERREQMGDAKRKEWPLMESMSFLQLHVKMRRTYKEVQEYLTDISVRSTPTPRKLRRIAEGKNNTAERSLHSIIQIEKHELDPLPSTSYSASKCIPEEISIKIEEPDEETICVMDLDSEESCPLENSLQLIEEASVKAINHNDPDMLFCLSLYQSLQNISKKFRNKAKIDILHVVDKYEGNN